MVRQLPISAPASLTAGRPPLTTAQSVVVPPMSATRKSGRPERNPAPTTLAAGPDSTVSTGHSSATSAFMRDPSPLTIMSGASTDSASSTAAERLDQAADLRRQARIERRGQGAPWRVQARTEFVGAGDRLVAQLPHQRAGAQLVRGIADREAGGDGKAFDPRGAFLHRARQRGLIQRLELLAGGIVPAAQLEYRPGRVGEQAGARHHRVIEADQHRRHGAEATFDDGVGRQRRRHRNQLDRLAIRAARERRQHGADGLGDPQGQVPVGGQRLGARDDVATVLQQHRVGVGPAGVEAEPERALVRGPDPVLHVFDPTACAPRASPPQLAVT